MVIALAAYFTGLLMRRCMDSNPSVTSYPDIAGVAFGRKGRITALVFICLELYLVATGLLILEGDNLHKLSPHFGFKIGNTKMDGRHSFVIVAGLIIMPTLWLNDLSVLSYLSFGGGLPMAVSLYTFCYGAHAMFPTIYLSMKKKSQFPIVLIISFLTCTTTYVIMAILGYVIYGEDVQSQVTLNLPTEKASAKVAIYTILASPIAKYALTIMPIATAIENYLPVKHKNNNVISAMIKTSLLVSTVVLAIIFPSFESVTSLSGAALIVIVSFVLPCACYLKIFKVYRNFGVDLVVIMGLVVLAILVGVVGTYSSIRETFKHV
ncbi:Amino acid transporter, transmembrane [Artemisia annua]|uniref:Amino acid transporter, transmembrane n=1 Tax=Artemisia annua TaxID=35608 RepID=A0A2U1Q4J9_ARTAN|nr:Amino acid transporter, transmembrane [Artemisia annua]